jgi:hypothetical protein
MLSKEDEFSEHIRESIGGYDNCIGEFLDGCSQDNNDFQDVSNKNISALSDLHTLLTQNNTDFLNTINNLVQSNSTELHSKQTNSFDVSTKSLEEIRKEIGSVENRIVEFVEEEYISDVPSGMTPARQQYSYPRTLSRTRDHKQILSGYREQHGLPPSTPLPVMPEDSADEVCDGSLFEDKDESPPSFSFHSRTLSTKQITPKSSLRLSSSESESEKENLRPLNVRK